MSASPRVDRNVDRNNVPGSPLSPIEEPEHFSRNHPSGNHGADHGAEHNSDHPHGIEWVELARIAVVALAAAAVWFQVWEPFRRFSVIGICGCPDRRISDFQGSLREYRRTKNDDGTLDDHCPGFGAGYR